MGMTKEVKRLLESYSDIEMLKVDGFDDCIIGVSQRIGRQPVILYDMEKVIQSLMDDGMSRTEAQEYFEFNILGAWMGEGTPAFLNKGEI